MIKIHNGDLFKYINTVGGDILIPHIVNNILKWGAGFVLPLQRRFPCARDAFLANTAPKLGSVQFVSSDNIVVANMYAQVGIRSRSNLHPIDYDLVENCLYEVASYIKYNKSERDFKIVTPMFGCGLAGGDWNTIKQYIEQYWADFDVTVCVL